MMPRNAQNIGNNTTNGSAGTASNEITTASATNAHTINFSDDVIDNSLSEVATSLMSREFGNGAANQGTLVTHADVSMLNGNDNVSYVMDDGLTSFTGDTVECGGTDKGVVRANQWSSDLVWTFIGTGISMENGNTPVWLTIAQNLPYGTHVLHFKGNDTDDNFDIYLDGVEIAINQTGDVFHTSKEITIHQPKKPPVPEDACILADYMLMADFIPQASDGQAYISKGVRLIDASRDIFYNTTGSESLTISVSPSDGFSGYKVESSAASSGTSVTMRLPAFGTNIVHKGYASGARSLIHIDTTAQTVTKTAGTVANQEAFQYITTSKTLGVYNFGHNAVSGQNGLVSSYQIATPIHTSHHYQPFETPFLKELVGGDRNMEQHNLIVTPDGKSWDEVTRDTSYIGNGKLQITRDGGDGSDSDEDFIFDFFRGTKPGKIHMIQKDFAYAYDRVICLKAGEYDVKWDTIARTGGVQGQSRMFLNDAEIRRAEIAQPSGGRGQADIRFTLCLNRGDYLEIRAGNDLEGNQDAFLCYLRINKG